MEQLYLEQPVVDDSLNSAVDNPFLETGEVYTLWYTLKRIVKVVLTCVVRVNCGVR